MRLQAGSEKGNPFAKFVVIGVSCQQRVMFIFIFGDNILLDVYKRQTYTIKKALSPIEAITRDGAQIVLFNQQA